MNTKMIAGLVIVGVVGLVGSFLMQGSRTDTLPAPDSVNNMVFESTTDSTPSETSSYIPHTSTALSDNASRKRVLYFYATWCPSCIDANKEFEARQAELPEDVVVIRVNYNDPDTDDDEKALAKQYGITYQHTFVYIDAAGGEIEKWNGGAVDELLSKL